MAGLPATKPMDPEFVREVTASLAEQMGVDAKTFTAELEKDLAQSAEEWSAAAACSKNFYQSLRLLFDSLTIKLYIARAARKALEKRVAALEARPVLEYRGTFDGAKTYHRGQFATHDGSMWHAERETSDVPGTSSAWKLAVKHGRDARR